MDKPDSALPEDLDLPGHMFRTGTNPRQMEVRPCPRDGTAVVGTVSDVGEMVIFQGDIAIVPPPPPAPVESPLDETLWGIGISGNQYRWPGGIIPFVCEEAVRQVVEAAIRHWEQRTPIRFQAGIGDGDYVSFEQRDRSWSPVGRIGGGQAVSLEPGCSVGVVIHEIGHVVGLWHEQSREDRDLHVTIVEENVAAGEMFNFEKHVHDGDDLGAYDFRSIMHYPRDAFSRNGRDTIVTKNGEPIGQRQGLSSGDIAAVRALYPRLGW